MAAPARSTAHGLSRPTLSASWEGRPKIPLPRIELTVSATRLQRPIARTSPSLVVLACVVSGIASLYHKWGTIRQVDYNVKPARVEVSSRAHPKDPWVFQHARAAQNLHHGRNRVHGPAANPAPAGPRPPGARPGSLRVREEACLGLHAGGRQCPRCEQLCRKHF